VTNYTDSAGFFHVVGEVHNVGTDTSNYTAIAGTFYDAKGDVIYQDFTATMPHALPPGATNGFDLIVLSSTISAKVASYKLIVYTQPGWS
jgi:hypothetical protein